MSAGSTYRRIWSGTAATIAVLLAAVGIVGTPVGSLPALVAVAVALALVGMVWAATTAAPAHRTETVRRAAGLAVLGILAVVGASRLGPPAILVLTLLAATCPWVVALLRPPRQR